MLLVRNLRDHQNAWSSDQHEKFLRGCQVYIEGLKKSGKLISAQPLVREGKMVSGTQGSWREGPFSDTQEVIVGYYHILAEDEADAVSIAKGNPEFEFSSTARVEVRPVKSKEVKTGFVYPNQA